MKDSGIKCIGEIPEGWGVTKLKYVFKKNCTNLRVGPFGSALSGNDIKEEGNWIYNQRCVLDNNFSTNDSFIDDKKFNQLKAFAVNPGDILITTRGSIGKVAIVPDDAPKGILHPCIIKFVIDDNILNKKILKYLFNNTNVIQEQIKQKSNSTTIDVIYSYNLKEIVLPLPPLAEQQKIADFLDGKCSKIDALKKDIQSQLEILEQYKKSVITEAVTKGIARGVKMKDSGIEWIGKIPEHWKIQKGKYIFTQRSEKGNSIELQLLSPTQKYGVIPQSLYDEISGMNSVKLKENTDFNLLKTCHKGDYCISLRSFQGGFEYSKYEGVVSPAYQIFYPVIDIADGYFKYLFKDKNFIEKINSFTLSLRDGKPISYFDFSNMYLPLPPLAEQQQIADFLDAKCSSIDSIITAKKQQLAKLEDYKKSLIYEYVTGKKQVSL